MTLNSAPILVVLCCLVGAWKKTDQAVFIAPKISLPNEIVHSWAQYSPAFPVEIYQRPHGCDITQANILQRHGARFPTSGATTRIRSAVSKLQSVTPISNENLRFLKDWVYDLGQNDLIEFGARQGFDSGQEAFHRYTELISDDHLPFVRASDGDRVVLTATNWSAGFAEASHGIYIPPPPLLLNEAANDTLDDKMCPNVGEPDEYTTLWENTFAPPIRDRLNAAAVGANLSNADIPSLISLCSFDTLAKMTPSPWCGIFVIQDFMEYEYHGDLDKYYGTGYGQLLGPVQGVGYVNELLARLTGKPVSDATQTNSTLDSSPITFPLNRTLYADFSHDNQMVAIFSAMGILRPQVPLDPTLPDPDRSWIISQMTPFNGKLVTERLLCHGVGSVRLLLNDAVVPLDFCGAGPDGICTLDAFVDSQSYSRNNGEGDWEKCFS
ncbi:phytase [Hysterangium stoloniferum]|nr:phytase [Hysterangium stoloniferum]